MYFSRSTLVAILSSPLLALAASTANPFSIPTSGLSATAGQPVTLTWNPTTSGTISLILRSGSSNNLQAGTYIAQNLQNSGSYTWTPSTQITRGSDYTVEIVDDTNTSNTNYTPYFVIDSTNTVAYSTSDISLAAPSSTISVSTASNTNSATATSSGASSSSATGTSSRSSGSATAASTASGSSSASGSSASSSGTSGTSSMRTSASASSSGAAFQSGSSSSSSASAQSTNGAPRATAAAGVMGLLALGAMAL